MARSRNIKPALFRNETLAECSPLARLLFAGLWCLADREGRLEDRPKRIRAELLPYDDCSVDAMLDELHQAGFILRYQHGEQRFIQVVNFAKHQNPHIKEPASTIPAPGEHQTSTIPAPGEHQASTVPEPGEHGTGPADSLLLIPDSLNPSTATTSPDADQLQCPVEKIVEAYQRLMPNNPKCKVLNASRKVAIKARWNEAAKLNCWPFGYSTAADGLQAWEQFFAVCAESAFLTGHAQPQPGKPPFLADIDFLLSPKGFAGCLENKYHREVE